MVQKNETELIFLELFSFFRPSGFWHSGGIFKRYHFYIFGALVLAFEPGLVNYNLGQIFGTSRQVWLLHATFPFFQKCGLCPRISEGVRMNHSSLHQSILRSREVSHSSSWAVNTKHAFYSVYGRILQTSGQLFFVIFVFMIEQRPST